MKTGHLEERTNLDRPRRRFGFTRTWDRTHEEELQDCPMFNGKYMAYVLWRPGLGKHANETCAMWTVVTETSPRLLIAMTLRELRKDLRLMAEEGP